MELPSLFIQIDLPPISYYLPIHAHSLDSQYYNGSYQVTTLKPRILPLSLTIQVRKILISRLPVLIVVPLQQQAPLPATNVSCSLASVVVCDRPNGFPLTHMNEASFSHVVASIPTSQMLSPLRVVAQSI